MLSPEDIYTLARVMGAGIALGLGGIGAAIGMGMTAAEADISMVRQPSKQGLLLRTMLIGQAVGGSPSIFALVIGMLMLFLRPADPDQVGWTIFAVFLGSGLAIGLGCFGSGWGCGMPGAEACRGVARNPRRSFQVTSAMVIGQAVAQSPAIFATVVSLMLLFVFRQPGTDLAVMGICIGAGLAVGAGALGPGIGSGWTAGGAVSGLSRWPDSHALTIRTMLVGQGVCQTPAVFGLLVAFILMFAGQNIESDIVGFSKAMAAGLCAGFGGIGPGIGSGIAGSGGCSASAGRPRYDSLIMRTMLIGQAVSQSTAIYALIIAFLLLYM